MRSKPHNHGGRPGLHGHVPGARRPRLRCRFRHLRAGLQGHGHGGGVHRPGRRPVGPVPQPRWHCLPEEARLLPGRHLDLRQRLDLQGRPHRLPRGGDQRRAEDPVGLPAALLLGTADQRHLDLRPRPQHPLRADHRVEGPEPLRRPLPQHQGGPARLRPQPDHRLADHPQRRAGGGRHRPLLRRRADPAHSGAQPVHLHHVGRGDARLEERLRHGLRLERRPAAQGEQQLLLGPVLSQQGDRRLQRRRPAVSEPHRHAL